MKTPPTQNKIRQSVIDQVPQLKRGKVWCHTCGKVQDVDSAECFRSIWPKCCGSTMSIDSPEERASLVGNRDGES